MDSSSQPAMTPSVTDDCTDLAALAAGDTQAFARIYDRHAAVVLSFCRRGAGRGGHESEDAMQETFVRAHGKLKDVSDCRGFRSWLLTIAGFVLRERRRSATRYQLHLSAAATAGGAGPRDAGAPIAVLAGQAPRSPQADAEHADNLTRLTAALDQLPDDERLAIHLQYLEHDPIESARTALGLSRSGFYKLLARARDHLAQLMTTEVTA